LDPYLDANLELRDTKDNNKSLNKRSPCQFPAYASPSNAHYSKKNVSGSADASGDRGAGNTVNNNVKIEGEAPVTTAGI